MYANEKININNFELPDCKPVVMSIQNVMAILDDHSKRSIKNLVRQGDDPDQKFCENVHRDYIQPPGSPLGHRASHAFEAEGQPKWYKPWSSRRLRCEALRR